MSYTKNNKDWKRTPGKPFGSWVSSDGWTAEYSYTWSGYACYKIRNAKGKIVATGGILGLDGRTLARGANMGKRSGEAQAAQRRNAGPMRHRLQPRGGAKAEDFSEEIWDGFCPAGKHGLDYEGQVCDLCREDLH